MAQKKKKVARIKQKKKSWFPIQAPKIFANKELGQSYLQSAEDAIGRTLEINGRDLTGNIKDQNAYITFAIEEFNGKSLLTRVVGYKVKPSHVKRMVRKNTSRLDDYLTLKTKEGHDLIVKTLIVTRSKVQRSTGTDLRVALKNHIQEELTKTAFPTFVSQVVSNRVQIAAKRKLSKIVPLKEATIRVLKLKSIAKAKKVAVEEPKEQEEAPAEE